MPIHELMGKQQPCFDLMAMKNKHSSGSYQSYEVPKPDLGILAIEASSRFAISSGASSAMRSLHSWILFVFNLQVLVVSTCLNPMLLLLNLQMGVSENSVPHVPNGFADHYPVFKWLFHWED